MNNKHNTEDRHDLGKRRLLLAAASLAAATALFPVAQAQAQDAEVRVGTNNVVSDAPFFIANRKGYFKEQGITIKLIPFDAGPKMIAPLGTGQLDAAAGAMSAGLYNAAARGINIKAVADKGSVEPGYDYMPILVKKSLVDSGKVKGFGDLKGLKVAEAAKGGSPGSKLNQALKSAGLSYKDVQHEYMGYPQHVTALSNGAVDASVTTEPSASLAVERGIAVKLPTDKVYGDQQVAVLLYSGEFIKNRPEVAKKFMIAYLKGARFYNDALKNGRFAGPAAAELISILSQETSVKDPELYKKIVPNAMDPDGKLNDASLKKDYEFYKEQGYLEGNIAAEQVVDRSFVEAALKVLGPYKPKQ